MESKVNIAASQILELEDAENFGNFPRASMDRIVRDLGGFPAPRFTGMQVEQIGQSTLRVGEGRFYRGDGSIYRFDPPGGQTIDLLDHLPAVAQRIAMIVSWGNTVDTALAPRTKQIDADNKLIQGFEHATESRRQAYVDFVLGQENATPQPPTIQSDYVAIAQVVLTPAGITSVTPLTANRIKSIRDNSESIGQIEGRLEAVGPQLDTLKTDISGLASNLGSKADAGLVYAMARDLARVKDLARLPDDYASYGADLFVDALDSDIEHPSYAATISEGLRFPSAGTATAHLALENPIEPRVTVNVDMAMPVWKEVVRTSVVGNQAEYPLTNTAIENVSVRKTGTPRTVRQFLGVSKVSLENSRMVADFDRAMAEALKRGEVWEVEYVTTGVGHGVSVLSAMVNKYIEYTVVDYHVSEVVEVENIAGSVMAQTILNSQDGYLVGVDLYFTKRASSGSVRVLVCDTDASGNPMLDRVFAEKTVTVEDIAVWPSLTAVNFAPTFLDKAQRYAIVLISSSAHFVSLVLNNKLAQGTIKYLIEGQWTNTGSENTDLALRTRFARFAAAETLVQLQPLELAGGIDSIRINADAVTPPSTRVEFEIRVGGTWRALSDGAADINILQSRPSLVQLRARLIGTTDVMPSLGLGATRSQVTVNRPADTGLVHVSTPRLMPAPVDRVEVMLRIENWDMAEHDCAVALLIGASYETTEMPDEVISTPALDDPAARIIKAVFNEPALGQYKIRISGNVGGSGQHYHISERVDLAFNS